jgi:hypothetical protein
MAEVVGAAGTGAIDAAAVTLGSSPDVTAAALRIAGVMGSAGDAAAVDGAGNGTPAAATFSEPETTVGAATPADLSAETAAWRNLKNALLNLVAKNSERGAAPRCRLSEKDAEMRHFAACRCVKEPIAGRWTYLRGHVTLRGIPITLRGIRML